MNPESLESTILNAVARATADDWLACSVGDLRNRMGEIDSDAANATINGIADAILSLAQENALLVGKREDGGKRLSFDFQRRPDHGYISNFFGRGSFEIKLTHEGRRLISTGSPENRFDESQDRKFARLAIEEARKSKAEDDGRAHPLVGAVVVKEGKVLASAHRGEAEGNHAEYIALERKLADTSVAGASVYTTLEPCTARNHPKIPCAARLIERKVRRVVIGMLDQQGIRVRVGMEATGNTSWFERLMMELSSRGRDLAAAPRQAHEVHEGEHRRRERTVNIWKRNLCCRSESK